MNVRVVLLALPLALFTVHLPQPHLFSLATLPRIRVEASKDHVVVTHEVNLPRGEWAGGDFQLYVAFGAPGAPRALDARIYAAGESGKDPAPDAPFEAIPVEIAFRRPPNAYLLLGSPVMAGVTLRIREAVFRRAVSASGVARIRIRSLHDLPAENAQTGREIVVRLGSRGGSPLALGRIEVVSLEPEPWILRTEAHLCGPDADPYPLAVSLAPRMPPAPTWPAPAAPSLSRRHVTDDLCIRFWTRVRQNDQAGQ